jgi:hypothetical protein
MAVLLYPLNDERAAMESTGVGEPLGVLTDISRMGSVGTGKAAPPPILGQSERVFAGGSLLGRAAELRPAADPGCSRAYCRSSASVV